MVKYMINVHWQLQGTDILFECKWQSKVGKFYSWTCVCSGVIQWVTPVRPYKESKKGTFAFLLMQDFCFRSPQHLPHHLHILITTGLYIIMKLEQSTSGLARGDASREDKPKSSHGEDHLLPPLHHPLPLLPPLPLSPPPASHHQRSKPGQNSLLFLLPFTPNAQKNSTADFWCCPQLPLAE